ncbi:tetratricopeptide repeat protein [Nocardioides lentus]|uniref:Tetratricopeptide repeat protein n=1 Tax=Nocardioides lentus TaxID=338077 RepID=A0ABN2PRT5_9ACTN
MTQQPFSRPGAVDLSALKRPAPAGPAGPGAARPGGSGGAPGGSPAQGGAYWVALDEQNFQTVLEASMSAPVFLVFFSPSRMPESATLADDVATLAEEFTGRFVAGLVDIDAVPQIAQAMQIPSVPLVVAVVDGRPVPLLQDVVPLEELRTAFTQVLQQLTAQGVTGRHQPLAGASAGGGDDPDAEPAVDPRFAPAEDALQRGDAAGAVAEYRRLVDANPADAEAAAGLARAQLLERAGTADLAEARAAAAADPDDVDAQLLVADLDLLGGHVEDSFGRLVGLVRRTREGERDRVREHLISLFTVVGNADPRVQRGRQDLASALF